MNCNDFQAVLMANKSWIRKITCPPPNTHAHTHAHTGSCFTACCAGFIQESDIRSFRLFSAVNECFADFYNTAWEGISRN